MARLWRTVAALAAVMVGGFSAAAEEVTAEQDGRHLVADLTLAPNKTIADNLLLVVHGSLSHKDGETIVAFREAMQQRGINTLAITLGLGLDNRHGPMDCTLPQLHRHRDALADIAVWLNWAHGHGARTIDLFGHSRGGNQVAWYALEHQQEPQIGKMVLLAPMTWDGEREAARYRERYGHGYEATLKTAQDMVKQSRGQDTLPKAVDFLTCPKARVGASAFADYYDDDPHKDTPWVLRGVDRKVLVIMGSDDSYVPDLPTRLAGSTLPQVTQKTIQGADHFFQDLAMDEVADAVAGYLTKD